MITLFFRKKREGVNSIEMVFSAIENQLLPHTSIQLPYEGASPITLFKNILFAHKHKTDVNHITGDAHYIALGLGRNTVLTIHDVQSALKINNPLKRFYVKLFWFYLPALIVNRITVISEFTKVELSKLIPFAKNKIVVIHNAFNPAIGYVKRGMNKRPVILHMGTKPNKNLERVLEALNKMNCLLIIVGKLTSRQSQILKDYRIDYENYFDVDYAEIVQYYQKCDIVSFPSTYEGFGLPILEANAVGRPILVGDIEVLHEIAGNAAYFVDPMDTDAIKQGFIELLNNSDLRSNLISCGLQNVQRFTPKAIAVQYNDLYNSLLRGK